MLKKYTIQSLLILISFSFNTISYSQNTKNETENVATLCKVWGFLKYYHPVLAGGKYNWDNELISFLPNYLKATSGKERSDSLEAWINRFGEIPKCKTCNDSLLMAAKLKPDFSWFQKSGFSKNLIKKLNFIKNNRIQNGQYYIKVISEDGIYLVLANHENTIHLFDFNSTPYGLLSVFRFWNFVEYWYPYKYNLPLSWNDVLNHFIKKMLTHKDATDYMLTMEEMIASLHDSHGYFRSAKTEEITGKYFMLVTVLLVENKLLITSLLNDSLAKASNLKVGDIIESIDGVQIKELIKELKPIIPASNNWSFDSKLSYFLNRSQNKKSHLKVVRNKEILTQIAAIRT